jgi:xanthine dehydrogenase YagR molybdenum-binding subunit
MTQIAAERMGLPLEKVTFLLGDSSFPRSPVEGGSWTAATIGSAVLAACDKLRKKLLRLARKLPASPLKHATPDEVVFADGWIRSAKDPARGASLIEILRQSQFHRLEAEAGAKPSSKQKQYSRYAHSAVFAEVQVDAELGTTVVTRVVSAVAAGRILNPKTARSQVLGGVVWGIGSALEEESVLDHGLGRFMNHSFAEYHVPVHADVREIEVIFVDEVDNIVNPLGAKGLGEIGIVGVAAAVANAIYNATGRRVRELPITPDKLL